MTISPSEKVSPMMAQWHECKKNSHDALLLFRLGDFYEAFYEDAHKLSQELNLTLTQRQGIPMAGVPAVSLDVTLEKLSCRGLKIAVAEQVEDPKKAKGLVDRQIVRIVTPGTFCSSTDSGRSHTFIAAVCLLPHPALSVCDLTTSDLWTCEAPSWDQIEAELYRLKPKEVVCDNKTLTQCEPLKKACELLGAVLSVVDSSFFNHERSIERLLKHFRVHTLDSFGLKDLPGCVRCVGALFQYVSECLKLPLNAVQSLKLLAQESSMQIDRSSQKNLEITEPLYEGHRGNTLLACLDKTITPMGSRLLKQWLLRPLQNPHSIEKRLDAVEDALLQTAVLCQARSQLLQIRDLKRLSTKLLCKQTSPKDLAALRHSLRALPQLHQLLQHLKRGVWKDLHESTAPLPQPLEWLERALCEEPAVRVGEGRVIKDGYNKDLDELREFRSQSQNWLSHYQAQLKEELGIKTLKVGYTPAFGYYIEVSKGQASNMPAHFNRRQTLVGSERFITPELKAYEDKVLHAQERIDSLERDLLEHLCTQLSAFCSSFEACSQALSQADCLLCLAEKARLGGYIRPKIHDEDELRIDQGRHPIVEEMIGKQNFIANDTHLDHGAGRMMILTGPNMAGKSTYIRQVALLVLMAQIGSFVPAKSMSLGVIDRIFIRVGASDDLARGQSTFMVEMSETANILHNATSKSLVILDEVGRGTSTWDGIAIARAIAEYLLTEKGKMAKTLFATHYSELTDLAKHYPLARNYQVVVKEWREEIVFLHQIQEGSADRSYGIHVACLAGLPNKVIARAKAIQHSLEAKPQAAKPICARPQLDLFNQPYITAKKDPRIEKISLVIDSWQVNHMTPLQALVEINRLQTLWKDEPST